MADGRKAREMTLTKTDIVLLDSIETLASCLQSNSTNCIERMLDQIQFECKKSSNPELLMTKIRKEGWHHCEILMAVTERKMDQLYVKDFRNYTLNTTFWDGVTAFLTAKERWYDVLHILRCANNHKRIKQWFCNLQEEEELALYNEVGNHTTGTDWFKIWFRTAIHCGLFRQLKLLLRSENENVQLAIYEDCTKFSESMQTFILLKTGRWRRSLTQNQSDQKVDFNKCVYLACEAGLFFLFVPPAEFDNTQRGVGKTPLAIAVYYNQPDLVRLLYQAGAAVSSSEILWLSRHPTLKERCEAESQEESSTPAVSCYPSTYDVNAAKEIKEFLLSKLPRSLEDLCLQEVTKHVGWGHERDRKVEQLEIPEVLKEMLTFKN